MLDIFQEGRFQEFFGQVHKKGNILEGYVLTCHK